MKFPRMAFSFLRRSFSWGEEEELLEKIQIFITIFLQLALVGSFVWGIYKGQWAAVFVSLVAMASIWLPIILIKKRNIYIPATFEFLLTLFIYASLFLGEAQQYYTKFWWWDTVLHTGSAIGLGFVGFLIVHSVYQRGSLRSNAGMLALFSFCFALSLGALWEIVEFGMDSFFGFDMQKSGLVDTMWDLIVDAVGAVIVSVAGYFYVKRKKHGFGVFHYFLTSYLKKNTRIRKDI